MDNKKEKKIYKVKFAYNLIESPGERISAKTKTVPDLSYSIQEILDRFSRNNNVDIGYHVPVYSPDESLDNDDLEEMKNMDLTDKFLHYSRLDEERKEAIAKSRQMALDENQKLMLLLQEQNDDATRKPGIPEKTD